MLTDLLLNVQLVNLSRFKRTSKKRYNNLNQGLTINNSTFDDTRLSSGVTAIRMAKKGKEAAEDSINVDSPSLAFKDKLVTFENTVFDGDDDCDA